MYGFGGLGEVEVDIWLDENLEERVGRPRGEF